jgi:protein-disulfide isomerase
MPPVNTFKKTALAAVLVLFAAQAQAAELTRAEVESIVHEYIVSHPQDILDSVQGYQEKSSRDKQVSAIKDNRETIYNDPLTPEAGNANGDVTVVEFFDYNCGYCKKVAPEVLGLIKDDKKVRVVFKDFPILGPSSEAAAKWALAAHKQKKYFEFFKAMMQNHAPITDELLEKVARDIGMDVAQGKKDAASTDVMLQIERNRSLAANMDIHGTPAFVVGEDLSPGAISLDEMKQMVAATRKGAGKK